MLRNVLEACWCVVCGPARSAGHGEVVHERDALRGVLEAGAAAAAVAQNFPVLHPGEDVLDAGTDLAVGGVVVLLPGWQVRAVGTALVGMIALGESASVPRLVCLMLVVCGVVGLKFFH